MKKIGIIGAGISGLSLGKILNSDFEIEILEKNNYVGGIARTKTVEDITYHTVGGHCLNSKNKNIMNYIFQEVLSQNNWHKVKRDSKIYFKNKFISYPIEFSIKEIAEFDVDLAFEITKDFLSSDEKKVAGNLEEWFKNTFGNTLAEEYFIPYNTKIWQSDLIKMNYSWIKDKLPIPNKKDFFESLIVNKSDSMPHSEFFYPNTNNQNSFIDALSSGLNVINNFEVTSIKQENNLWIINGSKKYDILVSTMPLDLLPGIIKNIPDDISEEAKKLKYNKVTNMLWKTKPIKYTWTYYPSSDSIFHRHIHIGNFFEPNQNYTITEAMGEHSYEKMFMHGEKLDYLLEPIDYNISEHAYVVYDQNYQSATSKIKNYMKEKEIYLLGRFGEWEYYNMDVCIEQALKLSKTIKDQA